MLHEEDFIEQQTIESRKKLIRLKKKFQLHEPNVTNKQYRRAERKRLEDGGVGEGGGKGRDGGK